MEDENKEQRLSNVAYSKYHFENFEDAIKSPKYTFKIPDYDEDGKIDMHLELIEDDTDKNESLRTDEG